MNIKKKLKKIKTNLIEVFFVENKIILQPNSLRIF